MLTAIFTQTNLPQIAKTLIKQKGEGCGDFVMTIVYLILNNENQNRIKN
jgi:hypothetical protein